MKTICFIIMLVISFHVNAQDWPNLARYENENKLLPKPSAGEKRIVFMGNSITEQWKKIDSSFFANKNYINRGISGQTSSQMLVRFRQDVILLQPKLVVISAGTNDIAENTGPISLENILNNIISMCDMAKANNIRVVLTSVLPAKVFSWRKQLEPAPKIIALNKMIRAYATKSKLVYVDYYSAMADPDGGLRSSFSKDGVHPNLMGYKIMEPLVVNGITKALKSE
jgi:lysophospholipase L1-like esterase